MTVAFVKNHTVASNKTAGTTLALTLDTAVSAGNLIVCYMVYDNAATASKPLISSIGVAAGESASWAGTGLNSNSTSTTAGSFASGGIRYIRTTVQWPAGSYTVTLDTSTVQKAGAFQEFSGVTTTGVGTLGTNYSTTTTAASASGSNGVIGDLVLGFIFGSNVAAAQAGDTDTTGGAWSAVFGIGSTGGNVATNNFGVGQYKILTVAGGQTLNNSAAMTAGNGAIVFGLQAAPEPAITQASYRIYDDGTETGAVALAAQDTAANGDVLFGDGIGQLRIRLQSTSGYPVATDDYQLQWEKNASGSWGNVSSVETLLDSYDQTSGSTIVSFQTTITGASQSFMGWSGTLTKVAFYMAKLGTPPGSLTARLYAHTGTYGTSGVPTGSALASTSSVAATTVTSSPSYLEFTFSTPYTLVAGVSYCVTVETSTGGDGSNYVGTYYNTVSPHGGNRGTFVGSWGTAANDTLFRVYGVIPSTVIPYASPNTTDGAVTTNRLGAGTGSFVAGKISETGLVTDLGWTANNYTEMLFPLSIVKANVVAGDVIRFRVLRNGATTGMTYTQVPTVNVIESTNPNPIIPIMATRIPS